jgi:3-oxoacyl-[acyl-carrier-protein] synthase II
MPFERRAVITGMGLLCPMGDSPAALLAGLCDEGVAPAGDGPAPSARSLAPEAPDPHLSGRNTYPLDRPARLLTAAAQLALTDGGWTHERLLRQDVGLFVGTMFSSVHTIARFDCQGQREGPSFVSPIDFANTVINAPAGQSAIWHGLRGVNQTVATGASSGLEAIGSAAEAVGRGRADCLLAGGVEEISPEALRALGEAGLLGRGPVRARPFDPASGGLVPAEGAALLVIEGDEAAASRGARPLAVILGHGRAFDASRRRDERRSVRSIVRSMRQAMEQAGLGPSDIDVVSASAGGLARLDGHEARAIAAVFEARAGSPPVCTVKSRLGEPLGAAGPLQCAAMIQAMRSGVLPAALDLRRYPDEVVPFAGAPRGGFRTCLINSLGFDGHSCSSVLACFAP